MNASAKQSECMVTIVNDLSNERQTLQLPTDVEEAKETCLAVKQAMLFAEQLDLLERYGPNPVIGDEEDLAVSVKIRKAGDTIVIHWWASGDVEAARLRMREVAEGRAM